MLKDKKILLGVTGSIAAYKAIYLVRLLRKQGAEVKVVMTPSARDFASPLTLSTLSNQPVLYDLSSENSWANHVMLGRWADVMLIAPLSCNTLAKMANGICDNLLMAIYLSATCPVVVAPAMDEDMWYHPATKRNLEKVLAYGNHIIPVEKGELASGLYGEGRMAEPETIISFIGSFLSTKPLEGKRALVTAGPTHEPIDPVRFIGNNSSGKMGVAIAKELASKGADVTLVLGPTDTQFQLNGIQTIRVNTAEEMAEACNRSFPKCDLAVMAAAVADYKTVQVAGEKIKKKADSMQIELTQTTDILKMLGEKKRNDQVLVGFALETTDEEKHAKEKLQKKNLDLIVLNSLNDDGAGFSVDTNKVTIFEKTGGVFKFGKKSKTDVAKDIVDTIIRLYYA